MALSWFNRLLKSKSHRAAQRPARSPRLLGLERLEARDVPTVFFSPQFGVGGGRNAGGVKLTNPPVEMIFWGSGWFSSTGPSASAAFGAAQSLLQGPYLGRLSQYGSTLGLAHVGVPAFDQSDPPANFTDADVQATIH